MNTIKARLFEPFFTTKGPAAGYTVLTAAAGDEALGVSARHLGEIHLLFTDVVMPRMSGRVLAQELAKTRPQVKVLFTSGYTDDAIVQTACSTQASPSSPSRSRPPT